GNVGIAANDPDRVASRLVNTIFGGRFTSLLNEALRVESGLTYGAGSSFDSRWVPGPFEIGSFTKNATTAQAIDLALQVLQKLHKDGVTAEQLASAKSYMKGQFPPRIETSAQLAGTIARNEFYGLDDSEVNQLEVRLDAVTPAIARQVIQKHFPQDILCLCSSARQRRSSRRCRNTRRRWMREAFPSRDSGLQRNSGPR